MTYHDAPKPYTEDSDAFKEYMEAEQVEKRRQLKEDFTDVE